MIKVAQIFNFHLGLFNSNFHYKGDTRWDRTIIQKNYQMAIIKFCLYIAQNCDQSCANFQFLKFKVQGLDIATLLGAEGPQQASLYMFLIFWKFRGSFLSLSFDFENFKILF